MPSKKLPLVSVVIVTYNGIEALKLCIPSIIKIDYPKNRYEFILVDNASDDDTADYVKKNYPKIKIIKNTSNLGYVGINSALPFCRGKYIYFTNNDITLNKKCLINLVNKIESDNNIAFVSNGIINYYDRKLESGGTWASKAMYCGHFQRESDASSVEIPYMGVGLIKKSVVDEFSYLFDPDYFIYAEDFDLGLRIRLLGMKSVMVFDAVNYHMHALTMKKYSTRYRNTFLLERNSLLTFFKVFSLRTVLLLLPYVLALRAVSIVKDIVTLSPKSALARLSALLWIASHPNVILKKRKALQKLRKADDKYILKIFSEKYLLKKPFIV